MQIGDYKKIQAKFDLKKKPYYDQIETLDTELEKKLESLCKRCEKQGHSTDYDRNKPRCKICGTFLEVPDNSIVSFDPMAFAKVYITAGSQ